MPDIKTLAASILRKSRESAGVQEKFFQENTAKIESCCLAMSKAFERGGRLLIMGNGGGSGRL